MKTYHVELLTSHPGIEQTYESTFCGGEIARNCATWADAQALAQTMDPKCGHVYATEREQAQPGSSARPLVRWQAVDLDILGSGRGPVAGLEHSA